MIGLCAGGRIAVGSMYMNEFIPEKYRLWVTTAMNITDSTTMLIQALYYSADRDWLPIHIYALMMCLLSLVAAILLPESPKFYYAKREFSKARSVIKLISRLNKPNIGQEQ